MTITAQIVSCQVHQHHMLGILLGVIAQIFGILLVLLRVARPLSSTGNGVNERLVAFYTAMSFGGRAKNAEASEIEIKEIRTGINTSQGTIEFEVITFVFLNKTARDDNLEHVATQAMLDATADVCLMLLIGQRRYSIADRMESIRLDIMLVDEHLQFAEFGICFIFLSFRHQCDESHLVAEMVKDDDVSIHYI